MFFRELLLWIIEGSKTNGGFGEQLAEVPGDPAQSVAGPL
jgi:hypothetical protein